MSSSALAGTHRHRRGRNAGGSLPAAWTSIRIDSHGRRRCSDILGPTEYDLTLQRVATFEGNAGPAGRSAFGILLGLHGLRVGDVCNLTVGDFDPGRGALHVATLKKGRPRTVDVESRLAMWISRFCASQRQPTPLLRACRGRALHESQLQRAWRKLSERWLGRQVRFHSLRHTAAQRHSEATKNLLLVKAFSRASIDGGHARVRRVGRHRQLVHAAPT